MNPISPSTNRAIEATAYARSASLGKVTRQPSTPAGGTQGVPAPNSLDRAESGISIRLDSISSEITVTKLGKDKDDDKDKDLLIIALSQSSLSLNVQLSGGNAGAYTNAAGAAGGPSVGLSVNFSA